MKKNITHQERFSCIFLSDNDDHRRFSGIHSTSFFYDFHIELLNIEVHMYPY